MFPQELCKIRASDFFLALDQEDDIHGKLPMITERLGNAKDMSQDLPLVVGCTTCINTPLLHAGLKGGSGPAAQRFCGLHGRQPKAMSLR